MGQVSGVTGARFGEPKSGGFFHYYNATGGRIKFGGKIGRQGRRIFWVGKLYFEGAWKPRPLRDD
jgi:hypothetical protein